MPRLRTAPDRSQGDRNRDRNASEEDPRDGRLLRRLSPRLATVASLIGLATAVAVVSPIALAARSHTFTATYAGHATGMRSGTTASGTATATGRGTLIGASTLHGSATGAVTSETCVVFRGTMVLKGRPGSVRLAVRGAHACATNANRVSFSGSATVTRGTSTFAGARGKLSFTGRYVKESGAVTISFRGSMTY
jgi:hypothetical protein